MKKLVTIFAFVVLAVNALASEPVFETYFENKTLRVDYILSGDANSCNVLLNELSSLPQWVGRRHNLDKLALEGVGNVKMTDLSTGEVIYRTSFSSLFSEWQETDEAKALKRGYEHTVLMPFPKSKVKITIEMNNKRRETVASFSHIVDPTDILIHKKGENHVNKYTYLHKGGSPEECIDVAIVGEGYTAKEMKLLRKDAKRAVEMILSVEPYKSSAKKFNFVLVETPSVDSGVSVPLKNDWKNTPFGSHFSTFYSDRYLTTTHVKSIHDALAGVPYEHIVILANTDVYGGGGIYNDYMLTTAHNKLFSYVVVHEFGHSFAGLADEYFYEGSDDIFSDTYPQDVEPWEQNITTLVNFESKWKDMLNGAPIPTPKDDKDKYAVGVFEGGGYAVHGVYRPAFNCRMRVNNVPEFCPVCERATQRMIDFYTK